MYKFKKRYSSLAIWAYPQNQVLLPGVFIIGVMGSFLTYRSKFYYAILKVHLGSYNGSTPGSEPDNEGPTPSPEA